MPSNRNADIKHASQKKKTRKRSRRPQITRDLHIKNLIIKKSCDYLKSPTEIAKELNISRETIAGIVKRFEERGTTEYKLFGGDLFSILKGHHRQFIINVVNENNKIILRELKAKVLEEFDDLKSVCITTLNRFVKKELRPKLKRSVSIKRKKSTFAFLVL